MKTALQVLGYSLILMGIIFLFFYSNIRVGKYPDISYDLIGLRVPEPPSWLSFLPGGSLLGWLYEFFSLHGLVRFLVLFVPAFFGGMLVAFSDERGKA